MDYNADGRMDLLTGSISGKVYLYRRKPNGTFNAPETLKAYQPNSGRLGDALNFGAGSSAVMADWYGTGKLDLLVGTGQGGVFLCKNEGSRQQPRFFEDGVRMKAGTRDIEVDGAAGPCVADWDLDGKLDLLVGCGSGEIRWYRNVGSPGEPRLESAVTLVPGLERESSPSAGAEPPTRSGRNAKLCVADWNGDGRPDLVVGDYVLERVDGRYRPHGWVWVYLRAGDGLAGPTQ